MRIKNISFTKKGWESFTGLSKTEQKKFLKSKNKIWNDKKIESLLKGVPNGKHSTGKASVSKTSKSKPVGKLGSGNSSEKPTNEASKD